MSFVTKGIMLVSVNLGYLVTNDKNVCSCEGDIYSTSFITKAEIAK